MEMLFMIYDFGGFLQVLYDMYYFVLGLFVLAQCLVELLVLILVMLDKEVWGFDHGLWGVLIKMYFDVDILMVQLSIDSSKFVVWYFEMGCKLVVL